MQIGHCSRQLAAVHTARTAMRPQSCKTPMRSSFNLVGPGLVPAGLAHDVPQFLTRLTVLFVVQCLALHQCIQVTNQVQAGHPCEVRAAPTQVEAVVAITIQVPDDGIFQLTQVEMRSIMRSMIILQNKNNQTDSKLSMTGLLLLNLLLKFNLVLFFLEGLLLVLPCGPTFVKCEGQSNAPNEQHSHIHLPP